jgi:phospholipid-translocating ATPase
MGMKLLSRDQNSIEIKNLAGVVE